MLLLLEELALTFLPIFVAMDAIGNVSFLLTLTHDLTPGERAHTVRQAMLTALLVGLSFLGLGKGIFLVLGITVADFLVAGGVVLVVLAVAELVTGNVQTGPGPSGMVGVVPIGTPLLVGPATLTTLLLLSEQYSIAVVVVAFALNLLVAWISFAQANNIARILGEGGLAGVSKIMGLLLAAIGVRMVRRGIMDILCREQICLLEQR